MTLVAKLFTAVVALLHGYFLVLEMFLWDKPTGRRIFGTTREFAVASKTLAANQGLYNGFLAGGLLWSFWLGERGIPVRIFFLCCVIVAGIYGGYSVNRRILFVQASPAALALAATLMASA
jgi:putative membrane protein